MHIRYDPSLDSVLSTFRVVPPYFEKWGVDQNTCDGFTLSDVFLFSAEKNIPIMEMFKQFAEQRTFMNYCTYVNCSDQFNSSTKFGWCSSKLQHLFRHLEQAFDSGKYDYGTIWVYRDEDREHKHLLGKIQVWK